MNNISFIISAIIVLLAGVIAYLLFVNPVIDPGAVTGALQTPVTSGENPQPGSSVHDLPVEPAAARAREQLADALGLEEKSIVIVRIENTTWSDGCLGLGAADEFCTQALVDGFRVEMLASGETYFYRTDTAGAVIRPEPQ